MVADRRMFRGRYDGPVSTTVIRSAAEREPRHVVQQRRFDTFHAANPNILADIIQLIRQRSLSGHTAASVKQTIAVLSYSAAPHSPVAHLNHEYAAYYAQLVVEHAPDIAPMLTIRRKTRRG